MTRKKRKGTILLQHSRITRSRKKRNGSDPPNLNYKNDYKKESTRKSPFYPKRRNQGAGKKKEDYPADEGVPAKNPAKGIDITSTQPVGGRSPATNRRLLKIVLLKTGGNPGDR